MHDPPRDAVLVALAGLTVLAVTAGLSGCSRDDSGAERTSSAQNSADATTEGTNDGPAGPAHDATPAPDPDGGAISRPDSTQAARMTCLGRRATLVGTHGDDRLTGTRGRDIIHALGGDDTVENVGADDRLCAGRGNDTVSTMATWQLGPIDLGPGDDRIHLPKATDVYGGTGNDHIVAEKGVGNLEGGPGDDYLRVITQQMPSGYPGNTPCLTFGHATRNVHVDLETEQARGQGRDTVVGFHCVNGTRFSDTLVGTDTRDGLQGGGGHDLILAAAGRDQASGGAGNDRLYMGSGDDYAIGDYGNDRLYGEDGADTLEGWTQSDYILGGTGNDQVYGAIYCAIGGNSYDTSGTLDGSPDELFGGRDNDYLVGDKGNDRIDGGPGLDWAQPGYHDGRIDWVEDIETYVAGCLEDVAMEDPFNPVTDTRQ